MHHKAQVFQDIRKETNGHGESEQNGGACRKAVLLAEALWRRKGLENSSTEKRVGIYIASTRCGADRAE